MTYPHTRLLPYYTYTCYSAYLCVYAYTHSASHTRVDACALRFIIFPYFFSTHFVDPSLNLSSVRSVSSPFIVVYSLRFSVPLRLFIYITPLSWT